MSFTSLQSIGKDLANLVIFSDNPIYEKEA